MATTTRIIVQQAINLDDPTITASKYPRFIVNMGTSITGVTVEDLTNAIVQTAESAAAAANSAAEALASENAAELAEQNAKISENNSKDSENAAAISEQNAKAYEISAEASKDAAATSEQNAATSENNAATYATNAENSKTLADAARDAAIAAQNAAETSAGESAASAAESLGHASDAEGFANQAADSATAAATSATESETSATESAGSATNATAEADRAKAEADRAASVVEEALTAEEIAGFYKSYRTKALADADVANRVVDEIVQVWAEDESHYGWYKVITDGTTKSLELTDSEVKLVSVNNIRADNNGNVQVTIPGGNPSLWLGEVTLFPYRNTDTIGYSGILLADGRELNRADYPDLWSSISAGLIPSVTEAEWQAGQNQFYSTGDGTSTFRLPNLLQGQALRSASANEDGTGSLKPQIPYVTTVNGVGPDDETGAIVIPLDGGDIEGIVPIINGGTGADTAADARANLGLGSVATESTVPINKGGTDATTAEGARTNLGLGSVAIENTVPVNKGGTNAATAEDARTNLGLGSVSTENVIPISKGGTGVALQEAIWAAIRPTGSTPLAGAPVSSNDATTKQYVDNLWNTGTVGPSMNGVMNYGVGMARLQDSRSYLVPYEVYSDGQLLDRAIWPELWAYAQLHAPITDAAWVADPAVRGKYSTGNGTTTFRVPDRNGVQKNGVNGFTGPDSIIGLFARGDGGVSANDGTILRSAAPNLQGDVKISGSSGGMDGATGVFEIVSPNTQSLTAGSVVAAAGAARFRASKVDATYGRNSVTGDLYPSHVIGAWVIRASGGFVAANTSWSVINGDATLPGSGTVGGGLVRSEYKLNNINYATSELTARKTVGSNVSSTKITSTSYDSSGVELQKAEYYFGSDGFLTVPFLMINTPGNSPATINGQSYSTVNMVDTSASSDIVGRSWRFGLSGAGGFNFIGRKRDDSTSGQIVISLPATGGTLALQGTSGRDFKKDIVDADPVEALNRILSQHMVNYVYKDDEQGRVRFGIIAEEAEIIAPQYIKHNAEPIDDILDEQGEKVGEVTRDRPSVDINPMVMDLLGAIHALQSQVNDLKAEIAELKK